LIWGHRAIPYALLGFGTLGLVTYSFGFWAAPFAIRTFGVPPGTVGTTIGLPGALASALGVVVGGRISDAWKARDPRGRVFTCMLAALLPAPFMLGMFLSPNFTQYAVLSPVVFFFVNLWAGSAVATYQDLVLPRMYATIGAVYLLGSTMVGLALGPYVTGKIATVTGSLLSGVLALLVAGPVACFFLWLLSREVSGAESSKAERAAIAGELA
jgi:MFS family permease